MKHLIIILFLTISSLTHGQHTDVSDTVIPWDNTQVDYRCPAPDTMSSYKALSEYSYELNTDLLNLWQKFQRWFFSMLRLSNGKLNFIGWLILALGMAAVVFMVIKLLGIPVKGLFIFSKTTKVTDLNFGLDNAGFEDDKLEDLLQGFVEGRAFRTATRILFLLCLRELSRQNHIQRYAYKTDREYYYEIDNGVVKTAFFSLMQQYERIWYGKFNIGEAAFTHLRKEFNRFFKLINPKHDSQ
ncbi:MULTISPECIES: DUF4129 domain-containing protein [unclassified Carboxylicivirga]|uniref:DUF4129 domain-containing protein n=1 Tax=Carboxylicivirga TaxID=1628153 RepID=UPI003D3479D8